MLVDLSSRQLRYFVAVAEELSFTRAAARVYIAQQALSAQIGQLEQRLGVPLFTRTTRKVELTPEGEAFLEDARSALEAIDRAVERVHRVHLHQGSGLRVGLHTGGALELTAPILKEFSRRVPQARVQMVEGRFDDPTNGLADGRADLAFVRPPLSAEGLEYATLFREPRRLVVGRDHPLASLPAVPLEDALREPMMPAGCRDQAWDDFWMLIEYRDADDRPETPALVASFLEELESVAAGIACSVAPAGHARFATHPGVVFLPFADEVSPSVCALAWRSGERNPLVRTFVEAATAVRDREHDLVAAIEDPD
jgi:DNA-binding transcriptional LysR family regulator